MTNYIEKIVDGDVWTRVCKESEIGSRTGKRVNISLEFDLALFRADGTVYCVSNVCPHKREAMIYDGVVENGVVTCPMHEWRFDVRTGANTTNASRLSCYPTKEEAGWVWVKLTESSP